MGVLDSRGKPVQATAPVPLHTFMEFATYVEQQFGAIKQGFDGVEATFKNIGNYFNATVTRIEFLFWFLGKQYPDLESQYRMFVDMKVADSVKAKADEKTGPDATIQTETQVALPFNLDLKD